jgi:hypothetical protein
MDFNFNHSWLTFYFLRIADFVPDGDDDDDDIDDDDEEEEDDDDDDDDDEEEEDAVVSVCITSRVDRSTRIENRLYAHRSPFCFTG